MHETLVVQEIDNSNQGSGKQYELLEFAEVCDEDGPPVAGVWVCVRVLSAREHRVLMTMHRMLQGGFQYSSNYSPDSITNWGTSLGIERIKDEPG